MSEVMARRDALAAKRETHAARWREIGEEFNTLLDNAAPNPLSSTDELRAGNLLEERRHASVQMERLDAEMKSIPRSRAEDWANILGLSRPKFDDLHPFARYCGDGENGLTSEEIKDRCTDLRIGKEGFRLSLEEFRLLAASPDFSPSYPTTVEPGFIKTRAYYGDTVRACRVFNTAYGTDLIISAHNDTSNKGEWVGPKAAATDGNTQPTTKVEFKQSRVSSKVMSYNRIDDRDVRAFSVGEMVARDGWERIGRAFEEGFVTGDGTGSNPLGIIQSAGAGITAAGQTTLTIDELVNLRYEVDRGYRVPGPEGRYAYMTDDGSGMIGYLVGDGVEKLFQSLDNSQQGRRNPKLRLSVSETMPDTWDGVPFIVSGEMEEMTAGKVPVIYGSFRYYGVRLVGEVEVRRWDNDTDSIRANEVRYIVQTWSDGLPIGGIVSGTTRSGATRYQSGAYKKITLKA